MEKKANMFPDGRLIGLHRRWRSGVTEKEEKNWFRERKKERKETHFLEQSEW
jgi:hypothetical protein